MPKSLHALMLIFIVWLWGCAGSNQSRKSAEAPASRTASANAINEDLDPLTLKDIDFQIPEKAKPAQTDALPVTSVAAADTSLVHVTGYQVQILQTEDATLARAAVRDAALMLGTTVEFVFDSPYFKVRAGGFVNRYDAEQLQELALSKGYASAWVVRTAVKVRASELERQ